MKIDKLFSGLTRISNGDYVLEGDLICDDNLEIELDDLLVVRGKIEVKLGIKADCGIEARYGIKAGSGIEAKTFINAGKRIFAGVSVYSSSENCKKTIKCAELQNGEICYGDLVIEHPSLK